MDFDPTGKVSLDHIYAQPDPRPYFRTLRELGYRIPQLAKPYFMRLIDEYRESRQIPAPNILDIGCSYGINAALLKCDLTMDELYDHYCGIGARMQAREELLARDRELIRSRNYLKCGRFVGLDVSQAALSYALAAGFIDDAVHADLEERDPTQRQRGQFAGTDIVISTGCLGYVSDRTILRVARAIGDPRPWMAHFVLRMFPFEPVAEGLAALGYETVRLERAFRQRRFASPEEQSLVLDTLSAVGADPPGMEADGWLYAELYISRPSGTNGRSIVDLAPGPAVTQVAKSRSHG